MVKYFRRNKQLQLFGLISPGALWILLFFNLPLEEQPFDRMIAEFSELSNVMRSIASLIVRDHVRAFGESMEEFPQERFPELVASLSKTISEEKLKTDFCQRFSKM